MKEDYLWDKIGNDSEIENLENSLKMFRQSESRAPKLPIANPVVVVKPLRLRNTRRLFSFGMVSFACLAIAIFGLGMYRVLNVGEGGVAQHETNVRPTETASAKSTNVEIEEPIEITKLAQQVNIAPKRVKFVPRKTRFRPRKRHRRSVPKKYKKPRIASAKPKTIELTVEEKHAYEQLMLALSITSSNLKAVKDKVQGD